MLTDLKTKEFLNDDDEEIKEKDENIETEEFKDDEEKAEW